MIERLSSQNYACDWRNTEKEITMCQISKSIVGLLLITVVFMGGCTASGSANTPTPSQLTAPAPTTELQRYDDPFTYCTAVGTIDVPDERYTGPKMPDSIIQGMVNQGVVSAEAPSEFKQNAVWRCMDHSVWVCHFGANLPCQEKADLSQTPTPEMKDFCTANPSADSIPAVVTGRATVYEWKCHQGKPEVARQIFQADPQGYLANFWYELPAR